MELKINIDETKFKDVIEKELKAFSSEELHEIIRECIVEALKNDEALKGLFIKPKTYSYEKDEPTQVLIEAARNIDLSDAYKEIQDKMINELKTNYKYVLENVMLQAMVTGLCQNYTFQANLEMVIRDTMLRFSNPN